METVWGGSVVGVRIRSTLGFGMFLRHFFRRSRLEPELEN